MEKIKFNIDDYKKEVEESNRECIALKLNTDRLTVEQKKEYIKNLNGLYEFSKLEKPKNIVFVSSPILLAFAGGAARYYWNEIKETSKTSATDSATDSATHSATYSATDSATDSATNSATNSATISATRSATYSATDSATDSATNSATNSATISATRSATRSATYSATDSATRSATESATRSTTHSATISATDSATRSTTHSATISATDSATHSATYSATDSLEICEGVLVPENYTNEINLFFKDMGLEYEQNTLKKYITSFNRIYQGGNCWADWDFYIDFYRKINKPIPGHDYTGFDYWKSLNIAGPRIVEKYFAMISEKPTAIKMKGNLAHNLNGPAIEYMDGVKFYMAYGNLIPSWIVTTPIREITKDMILKEKNADYRRYLIERIGIDKYIEILGDVKVVDVYESKVGGKYELLEVDLDNEKCKYLKMQNRSELVYHVEGVDNSVNTCKQALMFRNGMNVFKEPKFLS